MDVIGLVDDSVMRDDPSEKCPSEDNPTEDNLTDGRDWLIRQFRLEG